MSAVAIRCEGLGKRYRIGPRERYYALRDTLAGAMYAPFRGLSRLVNPRSAGNHPQSNNTIWALKDVSFEIKQGEVVGIIGRNGAGKSTLLKILSRITEPTEGTAEIHGRVGSLLEVGTGFHPELTGRENIYLNGAILGMRKAEIGRKFDEIVAFAEVEKFMDTPVKHYSSGMYMRLAFAVAAHLEPEILLVDEVLAVGDVAFQKKCLGKMENVAKEGRTVLFVSHNMAAVSQLCPTAILLENAKLKASGKVDVVVSQYLMTGGQNKGDADLTSCSLRRGTGEAVFEWAQSRNKDDQISQDFSIGDNIKVMFGLKFSEGCPSVKLAVEIRTADGVPLCNMTDVDSEFKLERTKEREVLSVCIQDVRLYPGSYYLSLWLGSTTSTEIFDYAQDCLMFNIIDGGKLTMRQLPRSAGLLFLTPEWKQETPC